jgi:hypothetical protein
VLGVKKCGLVKREGMGCVWSPIPVAFFKVMQQPQLYRMYAIHEQFIYDHVNSFSSKKKKARRKKDNKKS